MLLTATLALISLHATAGQDRHEVVKVIDGDTIHVSREGRVEKLRLLSVDTEEKIAGMVRGTSSKPETVFGEETAIWARDLFASLADDDGVTRVSLRFPDGREELDAYGRLLCHVILPDGRDFNLLLVELGKSPYFNKYGNSLIAHGAFVKAQADARSARLGIWNPETNRARTAGAPEARRPYDRLLPWWQARAAAIDEFRRRHTASPQEVIAADSCEALVAARLLGAPVEIFGSVERFYDESNGSLTVRFRGWTVLRRITCVWPGGNTWDDLSRAKPSRGSLRAVLPPDQLGGELERMLRESTQEFRQNFVYVTGRIVEGPRGPYVETAGKEAWRVAEPPVAPRDHGPGSESPGTR